MTSKPRAGIIMHDTIAAVWTILTNGESNTDMLALHMVESHVILGVSISCIMQDMKIACPSAAVFQRNHRNIHRGMAIFHLYMIPRMGLDTTS
jgi:hypothetical protein